MFASPAQKAYVTVERARLDLRLLHVTIEPLSALAQKLRTLVACWRWKGVPGSATESLGGKFPGALLAPGW